MREPTKENTVNPFVIVSDEMDYLSISYQWSKAITTPSEQSAYLETLRELEEIPPLILAPTNDDQGKTWAKDLEPKLRRLGAIVTVANIAGTYTSADARANADGPGLVLALAEAITAARQEYSARKIDAYRQKYSTAGYMDDFLAEVGKTASSPPIPTGFKKLDDVLDKGLVASLYIIGAISSLGKTTFVLQIADNIAASGQDVLLFSLEMARFELAGKSISRQTLLLADPSQKDLAMTTKDIITGSRYPEHSPNEIKLILRAVSEYKKAANHIFIVEATGNIGVKEIREYVARHEAITGRAPVVVVDYLQIMKPNDPRASDKQNTDWAVSELKRISRDYSIPVLAVSSLNRESYTATISMSAFKESGAIEYSSDVLIGLQVAGADDFATTDGSKGKNTKSIEEAKRQDPRLVELKILKNRNGKTGETIQYSYTPRFNLFVEEQ